MKIKNEYLSKLRLTNKEQFILIQKVMWRLNHLEDTDPLRIFTTGPAGCGKPFLIKLITQLILHHYDYKETQGEVVLLTSFTGKAAYNIGGTTLHQAFSLPTRLTCVYTSLADSTLNKKKQLLKNLEFLIIDEISKVGYDTFKWVHLRLQQIKQNNLPFGGVNVLLFGDLCQLPPVSESAIYKTPKNLLDCLAGTYLWNLFEIHKLTTIMRQKNLGFSTILTKTAKGIKLNDEEVDQINKRVIKLWESPPKGTIHIFPTNKLVDNFNNSLIEKFKEVFTAFAIDTYVGPKNGDSVDNLL